MKSITTKFGVVALMIFFISCNQSNNQSNQTDISSAEAIAAKPPKVGMVDFQQNLHCRQTDPTTGNADVPCKEGCSDNGKQFTVTVGADRKHYLSFKPGENENSTSFGYSTSNNYVTSLHCLDNGKVNGFDGNQKKDGREIFGGRTFNVNFVSTNNNKYNVQLDYNFTTNIENAGSGISAFNLPYKVKLYKDNTLILNPANITTGNSQIVFPIQSRGNYRIEFTADAISVKVIDYGNVRKFSSELRCDLSFKNIQ